MISQLKLEFQPNKNARYITDVVNGSVTRYTLPTEEDKRRALLSIIFLS